MTDFAERARIVKLQLSGLKDSAVADILSGAPRVAKEACDLIDDLLRAATSLPESISQALNSGDGVYRP